LPEPRAAWTPITSKDWLGALAVLLLVFLSTFPPVAPFLFLTPLGLAMRVSNVIALTMLFLTGAAYGKHAGRSPFIWGFSMVLVGSAMVGLAMSLGG
jgi:VIT1/CCC1 family predicted Fe2+/Mn2+ transporter